MIFKLNNQPYSVENIEYLRQDFINEKKIVLFVGAGINITTTNKLGWDGLLNNLFREAIIFNYSNPDQQESLKGLFDIEKGDYIEYKKFFAYKEFPAIFKASIIKQILGDNYINSIQYYIYSKCSYSILYDDISKSFNRDEFFNKDPKQADSPQYTTLYQIAKLILLYSSVVAVVNYNYDNFLSNAIRILKELFQSNNIKCQDIIPLDFSGVSNDREIKNRTIPIYHVHGYIPPPNELIVSKKNKIILSIEEFYDDFGDVFSWHTSTPIHLACNFTSIFMGLSLTDINTQRIIRHASNQHNNTKKMYYFTSTDMNSKDKNYEIYELLTKMKPKAILFTSLATLFTTSSMRAGWILPS